LLAGPQGQGNPVSQPSINVGVLVNLEYGPNGGGHVKCWERFAEAACGSPDLDLTVYYLGRRRTIELSANVRYELLPAFLNTRTLLFLRQGGGHADIAPYHPRLARLLARHDILHATDVLTFGATAARVAKRTGKPLVYSVHTAYPQYGRIYLREIIENLVGRGWPTRVLLDRWHLNDRIAAGIERRLVRQFVASDRLLAALPEDFPASLPPRAAGTISRLRRGIDRDLFHPAIREPQWLRQRFGIAGDDCICLFVGRMDDTKDVLVLRDAANILEARGVPMHWLFVGVGQHVESLRRELGARASLPGVVPQNDLARIFASADLFAFPSTHETFGNVVLEAKACALPALVSAHHATTQHVNRSGVDGIIVPDQAPHTWADSIAALAMDRAARERIAGAARRWVEEESPTWRQVLDEDLLPVWRGLAADESGGVRASSIVSSR
jgi:glycosyltransferase involved in cell wall biosynthesis